MRLTRRLMYAPVAVHTDLQNRLRYTIQVG